MEAQRALAPSGLRVAVDLSACGARVTNYTRAQLFAGRTSVAAAAAEMREAGVRVAGRVEWAT